MGRKGSEKNQLRQNERIEQNGTELVKMEKNWSKWNRINQNGTFSQNDLK